MKIISIYYYIFNLLNILIFLTFCCCASLSKVSYVTIILDGADRDEELFFEELTGIKTDHSTQKYQLSSRDSLYILDCELWRPRNYEHFFIGQSPHEGNEYIFVYHDSSFFYITQNNIDYSDDIKEKILNSTQYTDTSNLNSVSIREDFLPEKFDVCGFNFNFIDFPDWMVRNSKKIVKKSSDTLYWRIFRKESLTVGYVNVKNKSKKKFDKCLKNTDIRVKKVNKKFLNKKKYSISLSRFHYEEYLKKIRKRKI